MWLIAGLGNPGAKYLLTRHNIGFMAIDVFAKGLDIQMPFRDEREAQVLKFKLEDQDVLLVKPQTFMNKSGVAVRSLMDFYKTDKNHLIVVHDEVDLPFGTLKIQRNRGHGGNNGVRNIHEVLGDPDYVRIKLGVGRPANPHIDVAAHVLQNFAPEEQDQLVPFLNRAGDAIESLIFEGFQKAATRFSGSGIEDLKG